MRTMSLEELRLELPDACRRAAKVCRNTPELWHQGSLLDLDEEIELPISASTPLAQLVEKLQQPVRACLAGRVYLELGAPTGHTWSVELGRVWRRLFGPEILPSWNDAEGRTAEEVADRLEEMADRGWLEAE